MNITMKDRVAVITGGSKGIGIAVARRFAESGAKVAILARGAADLKAARELLARDSIEVRDYACDVSTPADIARAHEKIVGDLGPVDILVNNAGVTHLPIAMEEVTEADFDRIFAVNMKAIYLAARVLVPKMKARRKGAILNMASTAAVSPRPRLSWYNASKGWLVTATKSMAVELAPSGIRVNALNPVAGETPLLKSFMGEDTPEIRAKFLATIPLGRFSTPEDMGNAACYLCSDEASMVTGVALEVDGGRVI
jgi:3-oxoacyl-[acyl-carrier protein] reductase